MAAWGSEFSTPFVLTGAIALWGIAGFLVLWYESPNHTVWRERVQRLLRWLSTGGRREWIDVWRLSLAAAVAYAVGAIVNGLLGSYGCPSGPSDATTLSTSGQAFLGGRDPFTIAACGTTGNPVPAGLASVLIDSIGSLAGVVGILIVWGAISVAIIPLLWALSERDRRLTTIWVLASFLYLPIVAVQVDGASLALVPMTILLTIYLARRGWPRAAAIGGFLSTGRFVSLFPVLASTGRAGPRRIVAFSLALGVFAAVTGITVAIYGSQFTGPVFFLQFGRGGYSLNYWGILQGTGWLVPSAAVTAIQAGLTVALVAVAWRWGRSAIGSAALVLTGTLLLAQFLTYPELIFLLPLALLGTRIRWWLWAIGLVGISNYLLAVQSFSELGGSPIPSYGLDLILTGLLLALFLHLLRTEIGGRKAAALSGPVAPAARSSDWSATERTLPTE